MKLHFPETWKIGIFQCVTSGPLEFWRGVHNVRLHVAGKTFLNVMMFFEDAISWDEPVTQNVNLEGPPSMVFVPCVKTGKKARFKTRLMEAFPNNPNVDGWGARKCKLQFAGPRIPMSMVTTYLTYSSFRMHNKDAHNSVDSVNVVPQHETCHGVGWKRESLIRAIQVPWKPITSFCFNILLVILRYTMLTVNRSNQ